MLPFSSLPFSLIFQVLNFSGPAFSVAPYGWPWPLTRPRSISVPTAKDHHGLPGLQNGIAKFVMYRTDRKISVCRTYSLLDGVLTTQVTFIPLPLTPLLEQSFEKIDLHFTVTVVESWLRKKTIQRKLTNTSSLLLWSFLSQATQRWRNVFL